MTRLGRDPESHRDQERTRHGRDFGPGIHPPPEPPEQVDQPGAGPDRQDQLERPDRGVEVEGQQRRADHEQRCGDPAGQHVVPLGGAGIEETPVEIVHQVTGAPVEMGLDCRAVGRQHPGDHQSQEPRRQEPQHGRIGHVVADQVRVHVREGLRDVAQVGIDQHRAQGHQDPGPGPERVVHHVEEQGAGHGVLLAPGGEHPLGDVAAAPRLGPGIPDRPPLDRDRDQEHRERHRPVAEVRQQVDGVGRDLAEQPRQAADRRL